jgi:hypothetical protein
MDITKKQLREHTMSALIEHASAITETILSGIEAQEEPENARVFSLQNKARRVNSGSKSGRQGRRLRKIREFDYVTWRILDALVDIEKREKRDLLTSQVRNLPRLKDIIGQLGTAHSWNPTRDRLDDLWGEGLVYRRQEDHGARQRRGYHVLPKGQQVLEEHWPSGIEEAKQGA